MWSFIVFIVSPVHSRSTEAGPIPILCSAAEIYRGFCYPLYQGPDQPPTGVKELKLDGDIS